MRQERGISPDGLQWRGLAATLLSPPPLEGRVRRGTMCSSRLLVYNVMARTPNLLPDLFNLLVFNLRAVEQLVSSRHCLR